MKYRLVHTFLTLCLGIGILTWGDNLPAISNHTRFIANPKIAAFHNIPPLQEIDHFGPPTNFKVTSTDLTAHLNWEAPDTSLSISQFIVEVNPDNKLENASGDQRELDLTLNEGKHTFRVRTMALKDDLMRGKSVFTKSAFSNEIETTLTPPPPPPVIEVPWIPQPYAAPAPASCSRALWYPRFGICMDYGFYTDCSGKSILPLYVIQMDTCFGGNYLIGHNTNPWGNIRSANVGDMIRFNGNVYHITGSYYTPDCTYVGVKWLPAAVHLHTSSAGHCSPGFVLMAN